MLEAFTISSNSRFHTLMILTEKKSARASKLEFGTIILNELPRVYKNDIVFYSTLVSPLVDDEALSVHFLI